MNITKKTRRYSMANRKSGARPLAERADDFWRRVDKRGEDECWPWTGACDRGYGVWSFGSRGNLRTLRAHQAAFFFTNGWKPSGREKSGLVIRHTCDFRACCNPKHLIFGTYKQNYQDAVERGRATQWPHPKGSAHPRAKLNEYDIRIIRACYADGVSIKGLALFFGVTPPTMAFACKGKTWREVRP